MIRPLADEHGVVFRSPAPETIFCYSPGLARCSDGRLIATLDLGGPGVSGLPGPKSVHGDFGRPNQGKVFTSDDGGATWVHRADFPFLHARPFVAGATVYVLGQDNDLRIIRSDDNGDTWSEPVWLTRGQRWHQAPANVHQARGRIYLVMERQVYDDVRSWAVSAFAPVTLRGETGSDLTRRENWTFASELAFRDAIPTERLDFFGVPFFPSLRTQAYEAAPGRGAAPIGWLETNIVQFTDPDHLWHDPTGRTFHLWARAHTGGTGYAAVAKVVEQRDGSMVTMLETVPSGRTVVFAPCPGGQMKFHILQDEVSGLFWLLSSQATDSMTRADRLPAARYGLPNNERHRLQLHFSRNCIDWCFAGIVAMGGSPAQSRHYASMVIDGDDLRVLSRSGDAEASSAHDSNLITFHTVKRFRDLIY
jgi:hypothetical protein